jgi:hypothetical protein
MNKMDNYSTRKNMKLGHLQEIDGNGDYYVDHQTQKDK